MKKQLLKEIIEKKEKKIEFAIITNLENGKSCVFENGKSIDKNFEERMYIYQYRIFDKYKVKVAALAIFTDNNKNFHPKAYHSEIFGTSIHYQFMTYKLIDKTEADFRGSSNPFSIIMESAWLSLKKNQLSDEQLYSKKINFEIWSLMD